MDNHGEPLLMSNQELYSVMVQIKWTLKSQALANMQVKWRPKSASKWHPFQWEAILHCPTAEGGTGSSGRRSSTVRRQRDTERCPPR